MSAEKYVCHECHWHGLSAEVLRAPNPFEPAREVVGCPECRAVDSMELACDEPECWLLVSGGTPTPNGYRMTCCAHRPSA